MACGILSMLSGLKIIAPAWLSAKIHARRQEQNLGVMDFRRVSSTYHSPRHGTVS